MKFWFWAIMALVLTGCTGAFASQPTQPDEAGEGISQDSKDVVAPKNYPVLEDYGPAPELGNGIWLNSDVPLRLADLRGEVVLLEMWTFG